MTEDERRLKSEYNRKYYEANKDKLVAYSRTYRADNLDKVRASSRARRAASSPEEREARNAYLRNYNDANRDKVWAAKYDLTKEQFEEMLLSQDYSCAICGTKEPGGKRKVFSVDHCHTSSVVRGLLCNSCNVGLGHFKDNPESLEKAAAYLRKSKN